MNPAVAPARPASQGAPQEVMSRQRLARSAGLLYGLLAVLGMLGPLTLDSLLVSGDATETADRIAHSLALFEVSLGAWLLIVVVDLVLSVAFYLLLAPVSRGHSLLVAAFRLVYSAVVAALLVHPFTAHQLLTGPDGGDGHVRRQALMALETFSTGFLVALVFFGAHLVLLGMLLYRSRYVPRMICVFLVAGGVGYATDSLASLMMEGYGGMAAAVLLTPAVVGEIGLAVWLLLRGVTVPARSSDAGAREHDHHMLCAVVRGDGDRPHASS